jgi:2'-5' RNA ligase
MAARQRRKFGRSRKERIFFACTPDEKTAATVRALAENIKRSKSFQANLILPEHLHVTYFIFATGQGCRKRLSISRVVPHPESMSLAFDVVFGSAGSFRNSTGVYPFVLTSDVGEPIPILSALLTIALWNSLLSALSRDWV